MSLSLKLSNISKCYILVFFFCGLSLIAFYPGGMTHDSLFLYKQSLSEQYTQQVSPVIAFVWSYLNYINQGPFIMLLLIQTMLWGSILIFVKTWYEKHGYTKELWSFILVPLLPAILKTSGYIWKDVLFAFSYLLLAAIFSRIMLLDKKPGILIKLMAPIILFFGTACKFQAMYVAPIFIFWYLLVCRKFSKKMIITLTIILSLLMSCSIKYANNYLAKDFEQNNRVGWQEIKFFDLIYISLKQNKVLLPDYIIQDKRFDFKQFEKNFVSSTIFEVMYGGKSPVTFTTDPIKQKEIIACWETAVKAYPLTYLQARLYRISRLLTRFIDRAPSMLYYPNEVSEFMSDSYQASITNNFLSQSVEIYTKMFFWASFFALCLPFSIYYLYAGIKSYLKFRSPYGIITTFMNLTALVFVLVMMFIAVNKDFRYLFVCHILFHFSHPFAWRAIKEVRNAAA